MGLKWRFRGCPRCGGDVFIEQDAQGGYEQCLQCAWQQDFKASKKRVPAGMNAPTGR